MSSATARVAAMGQFWLQDGDTAPVIDPREPGNGLADPAEVGAVVLCSDHYGPVAVTVETHTEAPRAAADPLAYDDRPWQDVVEISVRCALGPLLVCDLTSGFVDDLPAIDTRGPGTYRVRVHVTGRDDPGVDADGLPAPSDAYLIVAWPAPPTSPLHIRLTDRRGLDSRWSQHQTRPPASARPSP